MNVEAARQIAEDEIALARQLNASSEHPGSVKHARLASIIIDLCSQIERLTTEVGPAYAETVPTPVDAEEPKKRSRPRKDAALGAVGGE